MRSRRWFAGLGVLLLAGLLPGHGQTFDVNGGQKSPSPGLGWGSNIEVTREARAAQTDLAKGEYVAATSHAQQAVKLAPQNADLWFLLGYASRLAGQYSLSIDAFKHGLQLKPGSISGLSGLAQTYAKAGRTEEARQLMMKVIAAAPKDVNALNLAGELTVNTDPAKAAEILRRSESMRPAARTELLLARAYQRTGKPAEAKRLLAQARNRAPRDPEVARAIAGVYRENQQYDQAISILRGLPSKTADILAELGYTYELAGQRQKAVDTYLEAVKISKGNLELQLSVAQALINVDQIKAALVFLEKVREQKPDHYRLHAILAHVERQANNIPNAIGEYRLALKNLPPAAPEGPLYPVQLRFDLYQAYDYNGDRAHAKEQLDAAAGELRTKENEGAPRSEFLRLRGVIEAASGDLTAAEKDLKEALALVPNSAPMMMNYGSVLWKLKRTDEAEELFQRALKANANNPDALTSLGYLARESGNNKDAEKYFTQVVKLNPKGFGAYLALGDLYASQQMFPSAQQNYETAFQHQPDNPLVLAGGANAALEAHNLDLAKHWLDRAKGETNDNPRVMRERQRYLTLTGSYQEAAVLGKKVLAQMPDDAEAPIYLAYDLYHLGQYDEAMTLSTTYEPKLKNNKDFALIEGYVHTHSGQLQEALADFNRALERDPKMATGYVSRGYVYNDLKSPEKSVKDFEQALALQPDYGEAHLGLAYAYLQEHRAQPAMDQLDIAEKILGKTRVSTLGRAEGFRQEHRLNEAVAEYTAALKEDPKDLVTQLALADSLFHLRRFKEAIATYNVALSLSPDNPLVYAQMAQSYASLHDRPETVRNVVEAERLGKGDGEVLLATGNALLTLGDENAAMQRFAAALESPDVSRVSTRLAVAQVFVKKNRWDDARRQIGLGFAEARVGDAQPATADDLVRAANIFLAIHDFDLAETYFKKAGVAGAAPRDVALGLTNTYLAEGDAGKARAALASLGNRESYMDDYDYIMAEANLFRNRQDTLHALYGFARANALEGQDENEQTVRSEYELAGEEGRQINRTFSISSEGNVAPVFEDINIYALDTQLVNPKSGLLPPPRHSVQVLGAEHYRVHLGGFPTISGFVGESMTKGQVSLPSINVVQNRNTYDTMFNGGITPVLHLGANTLTFNTGLQYTLRRDSISSVALNQDVFRQYLYLSSSSFFNWVAIRGSAIHESGPFQLQDLHSRDLAATIEFVVGHPWGSNFLLTGYSTRDLLFRPAIREYFTTSDYIGVEHKFSRRLTVTVLGEYLRSWRVDTLNFAIAQAIRPAARIEYNPGLHWSIQARSTFSRGEGFHVYDNSENEILVSYVRPVHRTLDDGHGGLRAAYPAEFAFGLQQQMFFNFGSQGKSVILPVVHIRLF